MNAKSRLASVLMIVGMVLVGTMNVGCGDESQSAGKDRSETTIRETGNEYIDTLIGFQDAVESEAIYDAYGYAEYFPSTQRAAIHAFCFVADQVRKDPATEELVDPGLTQRIVRKAEADLKSDRDVVAPRPARRAIKKLHAVLGLESLEYDLAKNYVRACYH